MGLFSFLFGKPVATIAVKEVEGRMQQKPRPLLIDVRQPEEFRGGHAPGAKLIPLGQLKTRMAELPKNREILCICQTGSRSKNAVRQLEAAGFKVTNVGGGMNAWTRAHLPVSNKK